MKNAEPNQNNISELGRTKVLKKPAPPKLFENAQVQLHWLSGQSYWIHKTDLRTSFFNYVTSYRID